MFLSSSLELNQSPISSFTAFLVVFKSPAMMMLGTGAGAWPCDKARAAAFRLLSRRSTNCRRMFIAHSVFHFNLSPLVSPGARWWPCPSMVWTLAAMMWMPSGDSKSA